MINSYKDISILKFQEIRAAVDMHPDSEIAQWYNILTLVTDKDKEYYMHQIKFREFKEIIQQHEWIMTEQMPDEWVKEFSVEGEKFFVIQHATEWSAEQFINMSTFTKDRSQIINNMHLILATLCVKEQGEIVSLHEFERRSKLFQEHLCILTAYPIAFFFALFLAKLSTSTQYSSWYQRMTEILNIQRKMDQEKAAWETSIPHGDGTM